MSARPGPAGEAGRVLLAGDWHGNTGWAETCLRTAADSGCEAVLQLGDFGLWPGRADEYLDRLDSAAGAAGVRLVWIDGNHEDHDALDRWRSGVDLADPVAMREHVAWAGRGSRWTWSGRRFGALGGAVSIDRFLRRPGVNWWPQEKVTAADVERLGDGPLDVLATHAAPGAVTFTVPPRLRLPASIIADAREVRTLLDGAVAATGAGLVVFGHHHMRVRSEAAGVRYEGLAHDKAGAPDAIAILDVASLTLAG